MRQLLGTISVLFSLLLCAQPMQKDDVEALLQNVMQTAGSQVNVVPVLDSLIKTTPTWDKNYPFYRLFRLEFEREPERLSTRISDIEYAIYYADSTNTFFGEEIEDESNFSNLYNMLGIYKKYQGNIAQAITCFTTASQKDPSNDLVWLNLASAYVHKGDLKTASNTLNSYVSEDTLFTYYFIRASYYFEQDALDDAEREINKCLIDSKGQDDFKTLLLAGKIQISKKNIDDACSYLHLAEDASASSQQQVAAYSTNKEWNYWISHMRLEQNELQELIEKHCK